MPSDALDDLTPLPPTLLVALNDFTFPKELSLILQERKLKGNGFAS